MRLVLPLAKYALQKSRVCRLTQHIFLFQNVNQGKGNFKIRFEN